MKCIKVHIKPTPENTPYVICSSHKPFVPEEGIEKGGEGEKGEENRRSIGNERKVGEMRTRIRRRRKRDEMDDTGGGKGEKGENM